MRSRNAELQAKRQKSCWLAAASTLAQRGEASVNVGYTASEGISTENRPLLGQLFDTLAVDSGASFNFTFGVFAGEGTEIEFLFARQNSRLQADGPLESETRFAWNWGGGAKFYFSPNVGAKVQLRWTPTYIKSDAAGLWCDPFYGCWQLVDNDYSNQFETSAGLTFRF